MKKFVFVFALLLTAAFAGPATVDATGLTVPVELDGYAWSATTGWISMNCDQSAGGGGSTCVGSTGPGPKVDYNVQIEPDGSMSGYAWSSIAGWIRFGGLTGYPTGTGVADQSATAVGTYPNLDLVGWARACAGASNPAACSGGTNINAGGWDGWIALAGSASGGYEVSFTNGSADNNANSYAWGGPNTMGWIDFSPSVNGTVIPVTLRTQTDIVINGMNSTPGVPDAGGLYNVAFLADVVGIPEGDTVSYDLSLGALTQSGTVTGTASGPNFSPALRLSGVPFNTTDPLVLAVDMPEPGTVPETNETNVFTTSLTLAMPAPTISITGPVAVRAGDTALISWSVSAPYPVTCTVRGPGINTTAVVAGDQGSPATATNSATSAALQNAGRFEVSCVVGADTYTERHLVEVIPTFQEI